MGSEVWVRKESLVSRSGRLRGRQVKLEWMMVWSD